MALFPQLGPSYYDESHKDILQKMEHFHAESISVNQSFWAEADTDTRFEAGDQTVWTDVYGNLPANQRKQFNFNRIRRVVNMIGGHQRKNRKSTVVTPVDNADEETADQFSKILMWVHQKEGVLETISDSFHGALVTGMNLLQVWVDYRSDPVSGNIRVDNCSYNSFLMDPFFRKRDLSDCNAIWKRSFLKKAECISLLPDKKDEIMSMTGQQAKDGKFQFMPENYNFTGNKLLTYDEFYYRDYRTQRILIDSQSGETMEWKSNNEESLKEFLRVYPQVTIVDQEIPTVKLAIVVNGRVMYDGQNPMGTDKYPFVPVFAYYNPQMPYFPWRVQGVVRGLRDAQYLYNRRKIIELDILESQTNSGYIYKENALVNPKDIFLSGQGKGIALKQTANMTDVQKIVPPSVPAAMIQLSELLAREVMEISGVNEELLGSAVDDKAGILSMLRQGSGLTTLQILFDQLDASQKLLGKVMLDVIQANFTPGKVSRIIDEEPTDQFYSKAFGTYDAVVEDGINTSTQRQMQFAQLLHLKETGVPVPDDVIIKAATLQNKKELVEAIEAEKQQAQQMQEQQAQMAMQDQAATIEMSQARAVADRGLGLERLSRIRENEALAIERKAEAERERQTAHLNAVKALKEIDEIDINHIEKLLTLSNILKKQEIGSEVVEEKIKPHPMEEKIINMGMGANRIGPTQT